MDLLKSSKVVHRYPGQLRDDAESIERRQWYVDMEKNIFDSIGQREKLYRMALSESNQTNDEKIIVPSFSNNDVLMRNFCPKFKRLQPMNHVALESTNNIAICFPGIANGYNVFKNISNQLTSDRSLVYGVSLNGKMNLCTKMPSKSFRKIVYSIRDEVILLTRLENKKIVFIGHCFGCLIAYEVVRLLLFEKITIAGMISISSRPPIRQSKLNYEGDIPSKLHLLTDRELMKGISDIGFIPAILLERKDLCRRALPMIRADLKQLESYHVLPPYLPNQSVNTDELDEQVEDKIDQDELNELLDMPPSLFKITIPIFSIHGEEDIFVSDDDCKFWRLVSSVFHEHTTIPNCGHQLLHKPEVAFQVAGMLRRIIEPDEENQEDSRF